MNIDKTPNDDGKQQVLRVIEIKHLWKKTSDSFRTFLTKNNYLDEDSHMGYFEEWNCKFKYKHQYSSELKILKSLTKYNLGVNPNSNRVRKEMMVRTTTYRLRNKQISILEPNSQNRKKQPFEISYFNAHKEKVQNITCEAKLCNCGEVNCKKKKPNKCQFQDCKSQALLKLRNRWGYFRAQVL